MTTRVIRTLVAIAVVVALIGAIGLVSADMNASSTDDTENDPIEGHMSGGMGDNMDVGMMETMQGHMSDHDHGDHHDSGDGHC